LRKQLNIEQVHFVEIDSDDDDASDTDDESYSPDDRKHYGPYLPSRRYNGDEVPLTTRAVKHFTVGDQGDRLINLALGSRKPGRYATLVPILRASGEQPKKINIILRGSGKRIRKEQPTWHLDNCTFCS